MAYATGGHRGALVVGGTQVTEVDGAVWNWNLRNAEAGGWGRSHDYAVPVMPGVPTIEVEEPSWDSAQTVITDLVYSQITGGGAACYLYPQGQDSVNKYLYGTFILDDPSMSMSKEDIITLPFGLIASKDDTGRFGL